MAKKKKRKKDIKKALILNPQQEKFLNYYLDINSETFGNAYQSALKAKYSEEYAQNITALMPSWLSENIGDTQLLQKAVENIKNFLEMDISEPLIGMFGPVKDKKSGKIYRKDNVKKMRIKADLTKFVAKRLGRKRFGQEKQKTIVPIQINFGEARKEFE
jgi:ubiquinone biosynthesis protein UbiJ